MRHEKHEPLNGLAVDVEGAEAAVEGSNLIGKMTPDEDRGPTGMGKNATFSDRQKPSKLSLDKTY